MNRRTPPAVAAGLLRRFGPENDALSGDLAEGYAAGKSAWWYWRQVLAAVVSGRYRTFRRPLCWSAAATAAAMVIIEAPFLLHLPVPVSVGQWLLLALYLIPAAATICVPVGLTVGMVAAGPQRKSPRVVSLALTVALLGAVATFVMMGWVVPSLNQEYRLTLAGRLVARGAAELTTAELRSLMGAGNSVRLALAPISDSWDIALRYYGRWAVSFTPLAFAIFGLWAATLEGATRRVVVVATACAYVGYILSPPDWYRSFSAALTAWAPPATIAALPLLAASFRLNRSIGPQARPSVDLEDRSGPEGSRQLD